MLANINYKGRVSQDVTSKMKFSNSKPSQFVDKSGKYTLVFFKTGNCRIMGCKEEINMDNLQYDITNIRLQSLTIVINLGIVVHLYKLSKIVKCWYEPELFPALRIVKYDPICVNLFSTGKVVILGLRNLHYQGFVDNITYDLLNLINQIN